MPRSAREYSTVGGIVLYWVRDVSDFMTDKERALPPEEGIARCCKRLAAIYKSEESIGNLPIRMDGFCLFDAKHRSSEPLCKGIWT